MPRNDRVLWGLATLLSVALGLVVFAWLPNEKSMGFVQKIFYIHVPCAWVSFLAFGVTAWKGLRFLMTGDLAHDRVAAASAELGLIFVSLVLITGPLWARPVWGIWWTWDMRLTTTFILFLLFLSYRVLRASVSDRRRRARLAAVVGLIGGLDVPVVYMANRVKATQHPEPVIGGGEDSGLAPQFLYALLLGVAAMTVLYTAQLRSRVELARIEDEIEERRAERALAREGA